MLPHRTFAEVKEYQQFRTLSADLEVLQPAEGDNSEDARTARTEMFRKQQAAFEELCRFLAERVLRWNWTGPTGRLLGEPNDVYTDDEDAERPCHRVTGPADIERLHAAEIYYLLNVQEGDAPSEREDFLADSETTSSATSPRATEEPPATSAPSRTRA